MLEKLTWKFMAPPIDPATWPCMVCRDALATHRRAIRIKTIDITLIVCLACGQWGDLELWLHFNPKKGGG